MPYNTAMPASQRTLLSWVEREVLACRPIALRYFRSARLQVSRKADRSPVTQADRAIEARLRKALGRTCPGERIVGEEYGGAPPAHGSYWTVDPIDGTRAFTRGLPSFGIMVARIERGVPTLGLVHFPALDITMAAAPGVPAYEQAHGTRRRLPAARPVPLDRAVIFHGGSRWWARTRYAKGFARLTEACFLERAYGDCYGYLWSLRGAADVVLDYGVKLWDMAPLAALALATGRTLTNVSDHFSFSGPDTVMAHPALARTVTRILRGHK